MTSDGGVSGLFDAVKAAGKFIAPVLFPPLQAVNVGEYLDDRFAHGKNKAYLQQKFSEMKAKVSSLLVSVRNALVQFKRAHNDTKAQIATAKKVEATLAKQGRSADALKVATLRRRAEDLQGRESPVLSGLVEIRAHLQKANKLGAQVNDTGLGVVGIDDVAILVAIIGALAAAAYIVPKVVNAILSHVQSVVQNRQQLDAVAAGTLPAATYAKMKTDEQEIAAKNDADPLGGAFKTLAIFAGIGLLGFIGWKLWSRRRG